MPKFRIGTDDFKKLNDQDGYFVDKSLLIKEIIDGSDVTLIPRPRRFGKTLNMTMIRYFFEKSDENQAYLFEKYAIATYPQYMGHQGQYPVIYLTLKKIKGNTWADAKEQIIQMIGRCCSSAYLSLSSLRPEDQEIYTSLVSFRPSDTILSISLELLTLWLYKFHKKPVIILIDEYDTPMIEAWTRGYYDEMATFMRAWLGAGLKQEHGHALYRAVVTGILRIAKESIFSELNNLDVASPLMIGPYSDKFGFTEPEMNRILDVFHAQSHAEIIRDWYNGYSYGGQTIYNPWSVISYIQAIPNPPGPKWLNTSSNALVYEELAIGGLEIKRDLEILLAGEEIRYPISETITFTDIGKNSMNIWSFLYYSGYLKADNPQPDLRRRITYQLSIPNREISYTYENFIESLYTRTDGGLDALLKCFLGERSLLHLESILQDLTLSLVSIYDLAKLPEAVYHAFVLGLLANLRTIYEIRSNPEAGYGRADILMIPKNTQHLSAYIIEFKTTYAKKGKEKTIRNAIGQIREKEYSSAVLNAGIMPDKIIKLAIILQGKNVIVEIENYDTYGSA
jgi:hypothetical protein